MEKGAQSTTRAPNQDVKIPKQSVRKHLSF